MFFFSQYWCRTFWVLILSYLPTVLNATRRVPEVFRSEVKFKFFAAINQILPVLIRGEHSGTRGGGGGEGAVFQPRNGRDWLHLSSVTRSVALLWYKQEICFEGRVATKTVRSVSSLSSGMSPRSLDWVRGLIPWQRLFSELTKIVAF